MSQPCVFSEDGVLNRIVNRYSTLNLYVLFHFPYIYETFAIVDVIRIILLSGTRSCTYRYSNLSVVPTCSSNK